jgi:hypothetical protein
MYLWPTVMYLGIGLSAAAMPILVLNAVSQDRSGQSTAVNFTIRYVGSALGVQIAATMISASAGPSGVPGENGYTYAFAFQAAAAAAAFVVALALPRAPGDRSSTVTSPDAAVDKAIVSSEIV